MRNSDITYAKAVAIMLMVMCHGMAYEVPFIYMFHMPLFFFFSGYCFKEKYLFTPKQFIWRRIKGIYWPYVKWSLIFLLLHNAFYAINIYNSQFGWMGTVSQQYDAGDIVDKSKNIVLHMMGHEPLLGGYWFMRALFLGSILSFGGLWIGQRYFKRLSLDVRIVSWFAIVLLASMALSFWRPEEASFYIDSQVCLASVFFLIGLLFKVKNVEKFGWKKCCLAFSLILVGSFIWKIGMNESFYSVHKTIPYVVTGVLGAWLVYSLPWNKLQGRIANAVQFIGNNTLTILTWHFLSFKIVSLIIISIYNLPIVRLAEFPVITDYAVQGWWLAYFLAAIVVTCAIAYSNRWIRYSWIKL